MSDIPLNTKTTNATPAASQYQNVLSYAPTQQQATNSGSTGIRAWIGSNPGQQAGNGSDLETRLQRIERGQKVVRAGRVIPTVPQFRSQTYISQTSANSAFVPHNVGTANFTAGQVPDRIAPSTNNQLIRFPVSPTQE